MVYTIGLIVFIVIVIPVGIRIYKALYDDLKSK